MGKYTAFVKQDEKLRMQCKAGEHTMYLDEPEKDGGTGKYMNPVEAILSALGACKCITAIELAEDFGINFKSIEFEVSGDIEAIEKIGPALARGFKTITTKVKIKADNSKEEIEKFIRHIEIVCPVRNSLVRQTECITEIEYI